MCAESIQKREYSRIKSSIVVKIPRCDLQCYGLATNLSEKGMCIQTGLCLPCNTEGNIFIPVQDEDIEVAMRVRWIDEGPDFYDMMGVEILGTPKKYRQLVNKLLS
jgi:hypothetical protein